jgi:DNA helicase-2/ATP-dependent DNA helicase PcrA
LETFLEKNTKRYDIVIARHVLPFTSDPLTLITKLNTIANIFVFTCFGPTDDWKDEDYIITLTKDELHDLFAPNTIKHYSETFEETKTYKGGSKFWHYHTFVTGNRALFPLKIWPCYHVLHMTNFPITPTNLPYTEGLNEPQRQAVLHTEGPLMVLAGAGSGKTRVITHRIVHLIHQGIAPHNILAMTFTNKSAGEMRERAIALTKKYPPSNRAVIDSMPVVTTFHALGVRLLREFHEAVGLRRHFTIYDRSDSQKAVKQGIEQVGYNPKEFEPRKILSMISRAKGDAMTRLAYSDAASSFLEEVVAQVWEKYEDILHKEQSLDFDDLLVKMLRMLEDNKTIRERLQQRYQYIHIDEYQDTNKVQFRIAELLAGDAHNICVVGDIDQCLVGDTLVTMSDSSQKPIKQVKLGEQVLSNYGSGDYRPAAVTKVHTNTPKTDLVTIKTEAGRTLTCTPHHLHFAGYRLDISPQLHYVYLMRRDGIGYRLGTSSVYTKGQVKPILGFVQRLNQEHGDAIWVLATYNTVNRARAAEYELSLRYQIPTIPFVARKGVSTGGYVHDQIALDKIFAQFDTAASATKLLKSFHLQTTYPHHRPQVSKSNRQNVLVTLCGDHRGATPMHRISVAGSSPHTKQILEQAGYSIRSAKIGSKSWRYETCDQSYQKICTVVKQLQTLLPDAIVIEQGRLGTQTNVRNKNSLPVLPAASVRPGMVMFAADGTYDIVTTVTHGTKTQPVFDLTITPTHNFIANGIVTHNSIYSWRGADIKNVLQFERHFPNSTTILLEENYRSTQTIIAVSNDIIKKNKNRVEKNVFTNNTQGDKITLYASMTGYDEAEYVALTAKSLIADGAEPSSIAVLYRTNFQSRALEEAFLNFEVPYQLLGTKFFERREVKDVLSYLRLALNPGSNADLSRVINNPTRGIGKVTMLKVIAGDRASLNAGAIAKVQKFDNIMMDIAKAATEKKLSDTIKFIMKRSGLEEQFIEEGTEEAMERIENLRELVTLASRFDTVDPNEAIEQLLETAALQSDQDEIKDKEELNAVRLMTIHAAKGLEFAYVFVTGLEEGLFPHERIDDGKTDNEEERRLFYVALTRAEKKIYLTYAHMRTIFGQQKVNLPSSFINDISKDHVEAADPFGRGSSTSSGYETTVYLD